MAKKTYIVKHPKLALKPDGEKKARNFSTGDEVTLDEKHATSLLASGKLAEKGAPKEADKKKAKD